MCFIATNYDKDIVKVYLLLTMLDPIISTQVQKVSTFYSVFTLYFCRRGP